MNMKLELFPESDFLKVEVMREFSLEEAKQNILRYQDRNRRIGLVSNSFSLFIEPQIHLSIVDTES